MIKILYIDDQTCPVIICDICGSTIGDFSDGVAVFPDAATSGNKAEVLHAHKSASPGHPGCHERAEQRLGGPDACGWDDLGNHLYLLLGNIGIDLEWTLSNLIATYGPLDKMSALALEPYLDGPRTASEDPMPSLTGPAPLPAAGGNFQIHSQTAEILKFPKP
jgi:hypothetical protein